MTRWGGARSIWIATALALAGATACGGPQQAGPDLWAWEVERGVTFGELRDACLDWQEARVAEHIATHFGDDPNSSFVFVDPAALADALAASSEPCIRLRDSWPGERAPADVVAWLDLLAATQGTPRRDPEGVFAVRQQAPIRVARMAELLLFDTTVTMLLAERPSGDATSRAVSRTLLFTFGLDIGEATRLDDSMVILALAETVPEMSAELRSVPPEMAGWAALAGLLRYLAADLQRLAWCDRDTPFGARLDALVDAALAGEAADGSLSRAASYYVRNRDHFEARCLLPPSGV